MDSSTSGSKHRAFFYSKVLIAACAVITVLLELGSNHMLKHDSATYARVSSQYAQALKARHGEPGDPASVVMVGNSLMLYGVDMDRLRALTSDRMHIYPIFLEATGYYDWLYGLRRLFRNGSRPQVVVVGLGVNEFIADSVRPNYSPMMFFDLGDIFRVASELKINRTQTTGLLLEHFSAFWDMRGVIRLQVLRHTLPHCRALFALLSARAPIPPSPEFAKIAGSRLERLRALCEAHGAELVILIPPTPSSVDAVNELTMASERAGVEALVPINPANFPDRYYLSDDVHLNPDGAVVFTSALAVDLSRAISPLSGRPS
jgi:hypothetical protein